MVAMACRKHIDAFPLRPVLPLSALAVAAILLMWIGGVVAFRAAKGDAAQDVEVVLAFDRDVPLPSVHLTQVYRSGFSEEVFPDSWRKTEAGGDPDAAWWKAPPAACELRWTVSRRWARDVIIEIADASVPVFRSGYVRVGNATARLPREKVLGASAAGKRMVATAESPLPEPPTAKSIRASRLLRRSESRLPWFDGLLNYPGDVGFAGRWLRLWLHHPFTWITATWLALTCMFASSHRMRSFWREWLRNRLVESPRFGVGPDDLSDVARSSTWVYFAAGLGLVFAAALYLEWREPRYFLRDDNFSIFLPTITSVGRALAEGRFPDWTPRVFLGMPIAELGVFAATYPPIWISYAVSQLCSGDSTWTIDVFCWGHLLCGFATCFWVLRRDRLHPSVAAAAGISWALCGFALIAGRSWYYMTPVFAYVPMIAGMLHDLVRQDKKFPAGTTLPERAWILRWGVVWGLFFHAGNAQMWLYSVELCTIWVVWAWYRGLIGAGAILRLLRGTVLGLAIAAPLLVPQFFAVRSAQRPSGPVQGIEEGLAAVFLPYPLAACPSPSDWADPTQSHAGHFYYAGTLFAFAGLSSIAAGMGSRNFRRRWMTDPWIPVGLAALWLAMGNEGGLWRLQSYLPVLGAVYHPFKYLPFVHLAMILVGAPVLHQLLSRQSAESRRRGNRSDFLTGARRAAEVRSGGQGTAASPPLPCSAGGCAMVLFAASAVLMSWHVLHADTAFYNFGDATYAELPPRMAEILQPGSEPARVLPIAPFRSPASQFVWGLGLNFPLVYKLESIGGYGEFVRQTPEYRNVEAEVRRDPVATWRAYGVTHLVLHRCAAEPCLSGAREARRAETDTLFRDPRVQDWCRTTEPVFHNDRVAVFPLSETAPRAFGILEAGPPPAERPPERIPLPVRVEETRVVVDTRAFAQGGEVTVNYLCRPRSKVWIDGQAAEPSADDWGRLTMRIPPGSRELVVSYVASWNRGWLVAGMLLIVFAATGRMRRTGCSEGSAAGIPRPDRRDLQFVSIGISRPRAINRIILRKDRRRPGVAYG